MKIKLPDKDKIKRRSQQLGSMPNRLAKKLLEKIEKLKGKK